MRYCVFGAGAVGGSVAAALTEAGFPTDTIARGAHLKAMRENGLQIKRAHEAQKTVRVQAFTGEEYNRTPDVVFVCVKAYSLDSAIDFLKRVAKPGCVVIPLLNIFTTGETLQRELPNLLVTDGCIYIAASVEAPGVLAQQGDIFRIVYGVRDRKDDCPKLHKIAEDLKAAGITPVLTDHVRRDTLKKYAYTSPMASAGLYFDADAAAFQKPGEPRECFCALMCEIAALAKAMGAEFDIDIVKTNLSILDALTPDASTSMQRDIRAGKSSEMDGLIFTPVRLGRKYGVPTPTYEKIAKHFGFSE